MTDRSLDPSVEADFGPGRSGRRTADHPEGTEPLAPDLLRYAQADPAWRLATLAVHAGQAPDPLTGSVSPPIYQTSTFAQEAVGQPRGGWEYARTGNPTRARLEEAVAALEGGRFGLAFASGSATTAAIAALAVPGDEVVVSDDVYGGTYRLFEQVLRPMGIAARYVDLSTDAPAALAKALSPRTRLVWVETPSNPWLKLIDLEAVAKVLADRGGSSRPVLVADGTFASPVVQRPLALGADIVYHSATKYLAGHSDTVSGVLVTSREDLYERLHFLQNAVGAVPSPFDCYLVLRGLRTLPLRVERHASNALAVAQALAARRDVATVRYPGLAKGPQAHPQAALAARQMALSGGMVSFLPAARGGRSPEERARRFCEATHLFTLAESLGGVESLCEIPALMTHGSVQGSPLEVPASLVRLSVGIEDPADLVADVTQALDRA
ncbi:MAG TPA: aminotransferase class I/II-fold pyridoxal phosphate-dependent enzyme [Candidatus Limnocylindrales bacterium]|nr:aminotransferase class I/II-fold pyridoxal phosphate-dependent enzyme [Candidatus Limnocylindrales bacterium]